MSPMPNRRDRVGAGSTVRFVPFLISLAIAMTLVAGVLTIARWLTGDLMAEPGALGRFVQFVAGREAPEGGEEVGLPNVLSATVVGGVIGWGVAAAALRWVSRPRLVFTAVAVIGFVGWGVMAFTHAQTMTAALWLNAMRGVAALPIIGGLARQLPAAA